MYCFSSQEGVKLTYCTVLDVVRISGISNQILNESVGTGDASETEFTLNNPNIVEDSEIIYLNGTAKTRDTDYTINNNTGTITFMTAPATGVAITVKYKFFPDTVDLDNDDMNDFITQADAEIENWTGKKFTNANEVIEYFEGRKQKIQATDSVEEGQYYSESFEDKYVIMLSNYPVLSITSLEFIGDDLAVDDTLTENTDFHWFDYGKITLITSSKPEGPGKKRIKVTYTYGYTEVPAIVKRLSAVMASIMAFVNLTGGSYDEITSYTLGPKSVSVGEPYMNMRAAIEKLEVMKTQLLNEIGREFRMVVI